MSRLKTLLSTAAMLGVSVAAHAGAIYQAENYGPSATVFTTAPISFNAFDTTLGTLTSVEFNINNQQSVYTSSVTNNGQQTVNDVETIQTLIVTSDASSNAPAGLNSLAFETPAVSFSISGLAPAGTANFGPVTQGSSNATYYLTDLSDFENGAFSIEVTGGSPSELMFGGSETTTNSVVANGTLSLEYDYTPFATPATTVPEPASLALLGAGLLGAGLARRRRA